MIRLGTHVTRAVVGGHAAALNGNQFRECQPETVRKWVAEMSIKALSQLARKEGSQCYGMRLCVISARVLAKVFLPAGT